MSVRQFAKNQFVSIFDTNENQVASDFILDRNQTLKNIRAKIFIEGTLAGTEKMQCHISTASQTNGIFLSSNIISLSDISNFAANWLGWVRFDFIDHHLKSGDTYFAFLEMSGYTENEGTFSVGGIYDFPVPVYDNGAGQFIDHPLALQIFGHDL